MREGKGETGRDLALIVSFLKDENSQVWSRLTPGTMTSPWPSTQAAGIQELGPTSAASQEHCRMVEGNRAARISTDTPTGDQTTTDCATISVLGQVFFFFPKTVL